MTQITYENKIVTVEQLDQTIQFKLSDLNYMSRQEIINISADLFG